MKVENLIGIVAQESHRLLRIPLLAKIRIDDNTHFGAAVGRAEINEVNSPYGLTTLMMHYHEPCLLVCVDIVGIGLDILLQQITLIRSLAARHTPQTRIVLYMEQEIKVGKLGSAKEKSIGL